MFFSSRILAIVLLAGSLISFAFSENMLCRHWISGKDFLDAAEGDTLEFEHAPYDYDMYTWGTGIMSGLDFKADGSFELHHNVLCSTESPTLVFTGKWERLIDSTIHITTPGRHGHYLEIISLADNKLVFIKR